MKRTPAGKTFLSRKRNLVIPLLLLAAGYIAYSNSFHCSFHWDDIPAIVDNEAVRSGDAFAQLSTWADINFRPLSMFTFFLNWQSGGSVVWPFHLVNFLIHMVTSILVFYLTRYTVQLVLPDNRLEKRLVTAAALFAALLFLLHPVQTMAVTYIVQRMTLMAAMFYILSLLVYARARKSYLQEGKTTRSVILMGLAVVSGLAAVLSKQNAISFPAAFILYEIFFIRRPDGKACRRYIITAVSVMAIIVVVVTAAGRLPAETDQYTRLEYLAAQLGVLPAYLLLLFFPVSQNADYNIAPDVPMIGSLEIAGAVLLSGLMVAAVIFFRRNRLLSFGIFFFFLGLSVESGIIPIKDIMMEHRLYLPMFGAGMVAAGLILRYLPYHRLILFAVLMVFLFAVMAYATYERNKVWATEVSLWTDCLEKNPENPRAMYNLGLAYKLRSSGEQDSRQRIQDLALALKHFSDAGKTEKFRSQVGIELALIYLEMGEFDKAMEHVKQAVSLRPASEYVRFYIEGVILAKQGRYRESLGLLDESVSRKDDFALSHMWRGLVRTELRMYRDALDDLLKAVELDPGNTVLLINISNLYYYLRDYEQAMQYIREAGEAGQQVDPAYLETLEKALSKE